MTAIRPNAPLRPLRARSGERYSPDGATEAEITSTYLMGSWALALLLAGARVFVGGLVHQEGWMLAGALIALALVTAMGMTAVHRGANPLLAVTGLVLAVLAGTAAAAGLPGILTGFEIDLDSIVPTVEIRS